MYKLDSLNTEIFFFGSILILFVVMQRMHILEALEALSDRGVTGNFHQAQNDFNE